MRRPGDELVELLLGCAAVRDAGQRELILDRLDLDMRSRIRRSDVLRADVEAIVATCDRHRAVADLLAAVRRLEGETRAMLAIDAWRVRHSEADADARQMAPAMAQLWRVPALPPHFLARPEDMQRVVDALCAVCAGRGEQAGNVVGIAAARHGLHGMGGIGKTVLATAVARDSDVCAHFADGIYWLTVGQTPQLTTLQAQLGRDLGMDDTAFDSPADGKHKLTAALAGKRALLVLDDVWHVEHAAALEVVGQAGRILMTTRNLDVLTMRKAEAHALDIMTAEQARALLAEWTGVAVDALPAEATEVAEACGRLPLALTIAGALVLKPKGSWTRVLNRLREAKLDKLRGNIPEYPYRNVYQVIDASVDQLAAADTVERARECYAALAVFAEDETIPISALRVLWGIYGLDDEDDVDDLAGDLASYSLAATVRDSSLRLHDIQRAYARACHGDVAALHSALVDAYADICPAGDLARGPTVDDARRYFYARLPYHLVEAGRAGELRGLLVRYAWLAGKLRACGVAELIVDFESVAGLDRDLALIRDALRLSSHVLARDVAQLPGQLVGRLGLFRDDVATVRDLLNSVDDEPTVPWFCPIMANLTPPGGPLLMTFEGHSRSVNAVAMSENGKRALSGSDDFTLKLWATQSGALLRTFEGHSSPVNTVALSSDGQRALSGSHDRTLRLWDAESGLLLRSFDGHSSSIRAVALSGDGKLVLSGSDDRTLKLWDAESGALLRTFEGHSSSVLAVALSEDGKRALSGSHDRTLKLWDTEFSGSLLHTFEGHASSVRAVALSGDGKRALSGSDDNTLRFWDTEFGAFIRTLEGHTGWVWSVALSEDGKRALSASSDSVLKLWDIESGVPLRTFDGHSSLVLAVALNESKCALSGSDDSTLKLWDTESGAPFRSFEGHSGAVNAVALNEDGTRLLSGSDDRTLKLWDAESGALLRTLHGHRSWVRAVALSRDGTRALSGSGDKTVRLWDSESGALIHKFEGHEGWVRAVALSSDGTRALSGSGDTTLKLWDIESGALLRTFEAHRNWVLAVALSNDGQRALSGSRDKTLKFWNTENGTLLRTFEGHSSSVRAVALSGDASLALSGSADSTLKLWDIESGELVRTLKVSSSVRAVALSEDGKRALASSDDRTLKLWDIDTGRVVAIFSAEAAIHGCALSVNPTPLVAAGDQSGGVHFLRLIEPIR